MIYQYKSQNGFFSVLMLILFLFLFYFIIKGFYLLLWWIGPILLLYSYFFLDKKVTHDYIKSVFSTLKSNPFLGIIYIIGTVVGFPFVSGFLFVKAYLKNKIKKMGVDMNNPFQENKSFLGDDTMEEFTDFEIIEDDIPVTKEKEYL